MLKVRSHLKGIKHESYANVPVDFGPRGLDCSLGINPYGFPNQVSRSIKMMNSSLINHYPHGDIKLKNGIIKFWEGFSKLELENVELAGGSIGAITKINRMFIDRGTIVLGYAPQFPDFMSDVESMGGMYEAVDMSGGNGKFDADRFIAEIDDRHVLCYIDNPNNPTGQIIPVESIERIVEHAAEKNICVLVDEAYGDFMEKDNSAITLVDKYDNLIVIKSFSKGFGMAGLRVGYAVGCTEIMEIYRKVSVPFSVSGIAAIVAEEAMKDEGFLEKSRKKIADAKEILLKEIGFLEHMETSLSVPIMTLVHPDSEVDLYQELINIEVLAVPGASFEGIGKNCVRLRIHSDVDILVKRINELERIQTGGNNEY